VKHHKRVNSVRECIRTTSGMVFPFLCRELARGQQKKLVELKAFDRYE